MLESLPVALASAAVAPNLAQQHTHARARPPNPPVHDAPGVQVVSAVTLLSVTLASVAELSVPLVQVHPVNV